MRRGRSDSFTLLPNQKKMLSEIYAGYGRKGGSYHGDISLYSKRLSGAVKRNLSYPASAYLNGDVMKNEETGRISYIYFQKEVVYTSLMMCENAPPEWLHVPEENIKRFQQSIRYKERMIKMPHWKSLKSHFRNSVME